MTSGWNSGSPICREVARTIVNQAPWPNPQTANHEKFANRLSWVKDDSISATADVGITKPKVAMMIRSGISQVWGNVEISGDINSAMM